MNASTAIWVSGIVVFLIPALLLGVEIAADIALGFLEQIGHKPTIAKTCLTVGLCLMFVGGVLSWM